MFSYQPSAEKSIHRRLIRKRTKETLIIHKPGRGCGKKPLWAVYAKFTVFRKKRIDHLFVLFRLRGARRVNQRAAGFEQ
jgi:hypothetical protein